MAAPKRRVGKATPAWATWGRLALGAMFLGIADPASPAWSWLFSRAPELEAHLPGIRARPPPLFSLLASLLALHVLGLIDDRRALTASPKLLVMLAVAAWACASTDSRLLTGAAWRSRGGSRPRRSPPPRPVRVAASWPTAGAARSP